MNFVLLRNFTKEFKHGQTARKRVCKNLFFSWGYWTVYTSFVYTSFVNARNDGRSAHGSARSQGFPSRIFTGKGGEGRRGPCCYSTWRGGGLVGPGSTSQSVSRRHGTVGSSAHTGVIFRLFFSELRSWPVARGLYTVRTWTGMNLTSVQVSNPRPI